MTDQDPATIAEMLHKARTIAVVGMSNKPFRASNNIGKYLATNGYRVVPVNPQLSEVAGMKCHATLAAAQAATKAETGRGIDLVNVFRASEHVPPIVEDVIRLEIPYLWLQDEVVHDEAIARAREAGVKCVQNDCIFRRHAQLAGDH
ncbi:MAG TPA: CoA-binding protein [Terracidiphilus sp.]|nr:CoA-binding protein [Terracidiphilus sp.]